MFNDWRHSTSIFSEPDNLVRSRFGLSYIHVPRRGCIIRRLVAKEDHLQRATLAGTSGVVMHCYLPTFNCMLFPMQMEYPMSSITGISDHWGLVPGWLYLCNMCSNRGRQCAVRSICLHYLFLDKLTVDNVDLLKGSLSALGREDLKKLVEEYESANCISKLLLYL